MANGGLIRFGVLGAARIAPAALVKPAVRSRRATVYAVAARDRTRAESFAAKHNVTRVHADYAALLADPDIDAIYNPLPNGLHAEWTIAALEAGKHVLCEKPFTNNAAEAERVAAVAERYPDRVVMEAFHYRYHPFAERMRAICADGELGPLEHVEASFCFPLWRSSDIRWKYDLGGGALMDAGCYAVHMVRLLGGSEPEVTSATAKLRHPDVDRAMTAELAFPDGVTGRITASMWSTSVLRISAGARGSDGRLTAFNPLMPSMFGKLTVKDHRGKFSERADKKATYDYQLEAFCAAVLDGGPVLTPPADSIATMRVIDAIYTAAGMQPRGT